MGAAAITLGSGAPALASAASTSEFNPSVAIPGGTGASTPGLAVNPDGSIAVVGSAGPGAGCAVVSLTHDGSTARLLGRTPGGAACAIAAGPLQGGRAELAYASQSADGTDGGRSTNGGASFSSADTSGPIAMGSMAADPLVNGNGVSTLYLLTRDPASGLPRVAVSSDGGETYSLSSSLVDVMHLDSGLWEGTGPSVAAGNLVALRDDTGLRLYAAFETADGAADRLAQNAAQTDNLNRVYEAIGTVSQPAQGAAPAVTWSDYEVYAAPAGTALNNLAPSTAVDAAGRVYTAFADSHHVYLKADVDGTQWNAAVPPAAVDGVASGLPAGLDAAARPALAAGGNGMADLAWYGATGAGQWGVYLAHTLDGGASWTATTVSDHPVFQGALSPADAGETIALGIDQVTGAAAVAYAAGQAASGTPSLFATRQCTGPSAVTGNALVDDCVAPQPATPVLPGSTCPGPQVNDAPGDALDTSAAGSGGNVPSLDITHAQLLTADSADEQLVLSLDRLDAQLPTDVAQAVWRVSWTAGSTGYYAQATQTGSGPMAFMAGALRGDGSPGHSYAVQGMEVLGNNGQIRFTLPYAAIGNVTVGTTLRDISAATYALFTARGTVASAAQLVDRAPDAGFGAPYTLGQVCAPTADLPDVPAAALLPGVAGGAILIWTLVRRRRSRRPLDESAPTTDVETAKGN